MRTKAALTSTTSAISSTSDLPEIAGQKHLTLFIELLGHWSNIITTLMNYGFSKEMTASLLIPLHSRIIEMALECFRTWKNDKDIDSWCVKVLSIERGGGGGGGGEDVLGIHIDVLDGLLNQIALMRNILNQHYLFLFHTFSPLFLLPPVLPPRPPLPSASPSSILGNILLTKKLFAKTVKKQKIANENLIRCILAD